MVQGDAEEEWLRKQGEYISEGRANGSGKKNERIPTTPVNEKPKAQMDTNSNGANKEASKRTWRDTLDERPVNGGLKKPS